MDNDNQLVSATLQGDQQAFRQLVDRYQDYVFSIAWKILQNRPEAEEVAQDAFVKAYRALSGFEQRSRFSTWLYQIAWRTAIDKYRSRPARQHRLDDDENHLQLPDPAATPAEQLQEKNTARLVRQALDQLKPDDAALLSLYYLQEQSVREIAGITGLSSSNVKVKLFRLRSVLKKVLQKQLKNEVKNLL